MTPIEKAEYLICKFLDETPNESFYNPPVGASEYNSRKLSIYCALIAVDEILEATKTVIDRPEYSGIIYDSYWAKVKYELINLR